VSALARSPWTPAAGGVLIDIRLTPRSGGDVIEGVERLADGRAVLKARVRAPAFEGEANTALCRLVAKALHVAPRQVELAAGATSRVKRIRVAGDTAALLAALQRLTEAV